MSADLGAEILHKMERPTPGVAEEEAKSLKREDAEFENLRDRYGRLFDPALHIMHQGKPKLTRDGNLSIRPGRGTKGAPPAAAMRPSIVPPAVDGIKAGGMPGQAPPDFRGIAQLTVLHTVSLCTIAFGSHWKADEHEVTAMVDAWEGYYRKRGISDVPPELLLAVTMGGYALPRAIHPETKKRLKQAKETVQGWFRKKSEPAPEVPGDARVDLGASG